MAEDLKKRVYQHKTKAVEGFTAKYNVNRLVYFEVTPNVTSAAAREKELTGWIGTKKIELIEALNPDWNDLSDNL